MDLSDLVYYPLLINMNKHIRKLALFALSSGIRVNMRVKSINNKKLLTILNLHRVGEDDGSSYKPLKPNLFEELLIFSSHFFTLTTLGEAHAVNINSIHKPLLILSFDDGYKDFIDVAMPLLWKYKIRVNQNIIPGCVSTGLPPLNVIAQDYVGRAPDDLLKRLKVPGFDVANDYRDRIRLGLRISRFIKNKQFVEQEILRGLLLKQFSNCNEFIPTKMMSVAEVKQCAGVHEIGAHSFNHSSMGFESDDFFDEDLNKCNEYFVKTIGMPAKVYAFPNGSYKHSQLQRPFVYGYEHVLLVNDMFSKLGNHIHNRFGFTSDQINEIPFRTTGGLSRVE